MRTQQPATTACRRALPAALLLALSLALMMAPATSLDLMREPPATSIEAPAPNVIVTVDDSAQVSEADLARMRASLRHAFANGTLADGRIRLAYQAMASCAGFDGACAFPNLMHPLEDRHRQQFLRWLDQLRPLGERRSLTAIGHAGEYLRTSGISSPWAYLPGQQQQPEYGCRRAFHLFLSSGGSYGGSPPAPGDHDNQPRTLPDGRSYVPLSPYAYPQGNTIADLSFHYWASDLRPDLARDTVPVHMPASAPLTFADLTLAPYWHPQNDPANWRHLTTHVIGFGAAASLPGKDLWGLLSGITPWTGDPTEELRHMALNGRGEFLAAIDEHVLSTALTRLLRPPSRPAGFRATGGVLGTSDIAAGDLAFVVGYDADDWQGSLKAFPLVRTGAGLQLAGEAIWSAAQRLATRNRDDGRVILTSRRGIGGIPFRWADLASAPPDGLDADGLGERRIAYLRGNPAWDGSLFRQRGRLPEMPAGINVLGDIVNSRPRVVQAPAGGRLDEGYGDFFRSRRVRPGIVYIGANDGMLHGFDTATGDERIAYVPRGVQDRLVELTRSGYADAHRFFVDGTPLAGDARLAGRWHTLLAGTLGMGGKGYFVLDVTDPGAFAESRAQGLVLLDNTAAADDPEADPDLGFMTGTPAVDALTGQPHQLMRARHPSGERRWALLLGNGAASRRGDAVLLVQFLEGARELLRVAANVPGGNGMLAIRPVDLDGDETADAVYGGDMHGNLWRFDLSGPPSEWRADRIFSARSAGNAAQAISTAPVIGTHPLGGLLVGFATGQLLYRQDRKPQYNTLYGIWDRSARLQGGQLGKPDHELSQTGRTRLVERRIGEGPGMTPLSYSNRDDSTFGWFIDLPDPQDRSLEPAAFLFREGSEAFFSLALERLETSPESCSSETPKLSHSGLVFGLHSGWPPAVLQRQSIMQQPGTQIVRDAESGQPYALTLAPASPTGIALKEEAAGQGAAIARLAALPNPEIAWRLSWRQLR